MPDYRVTMQHFVPPQSLDPVLQRDVRADWSGPLAPPSILLDYLYGVASIKRWVAPGIQPALDDRHQQEFRTLLPMSPTTLSSDADDDFDSDDTADADYAPPRAGRPRRIHHSSMEIASARAMDHAFHFYKRLKGYDPAMTFEMVREKQEKEAEQRSRQVGIVKVQGWLQASEPVTYLAC